MPIYLSRFIGRSFCGFNALTLNRLSFFFLSTTTHNWGVLSYSVAHKQSFFCERPPRPLDPRWLRVIFLISRPPLLTGVVAERFQLSEVPSLVKEGWTGHQEKRR